MFSRSIGIRHFRRFTTQCSPLQTTRIIVLKVANKQSPQGDDRVPKPHMGKKSGKQYEKWVPPHPIPPWWNPWRRYFPWWDPWDPWRPWWDPWRRENPWDIPPRPKHIYTKL